MPTVLMGLPSTFCQIVNKVDIYPKNQRFFNRKDKSQHENQFTARTTDTCGSSYKLISDENVPNVRNSVCLKFHTFSMVPTGLPPLVKACRCSSHSCSSWELLQKTVMRSIIPPATQPQHTLITLTSKAAFHTETHRAVNTLVIA